MKLCIDCTHYTFKSNLNWAYCVARAIIEPDYIDLVSGRLVKGHIKNEHMCDVARAVPSMCGPSGKWFAKAEVNAQQITSDPGSSTLDRVKKFLHW